MKQIIVASKTVLSKKIYLVGFLALVPLVFLFFVYIPVRSIPGNSLGFQLSIFSTRDYILTTIFSILMSLFLTMQVFVIRNATSKKNILTSVGTGGVGGYMATIGAIFGTAACGSCLFAIVGFLGASTVFTLLKYQWYIVSGAIVILLISIFLLSKKVNGICESCRIDKRKIK
ncbi:hypothetical protein HY086_02815 [Candidatus Gottesmanbacteria bacterium]|nr:hypothetical protein [Candidatus Gottesmanbacteria bacterium]